MPGILPMKVIKVGTSAQTRIAQACDRCRSKKIRCDGFRPTCSQCANVGFECKTSDKLSRRAFPRGYTESLEERVRALEAESRELKDLLDEKDEKIELLSKMHAHSPRSLSSRRPSSIHSFSEKGQIHENLEYERDVRFKLQQSPHLVPGVNTDLFFVGNSSSRALMLTFKRKLQECGKASSDFDIDVFFPSAARPSSRHLLPAEENALYTSPSRMFSDQMVNVFFQEWAPLFPVLHRPAFLSLYEQYTSNTSNIQDKKSLAQLNLVFAIAALSSKYNAHPELEACERQWMAALDHFSRETSLVALQCLILAQIYCVQKGDADKVLQYKGSAIAVSQRLGLNLSQKRFALGTLTVETRKKVFWSLYAVDCFSAAFLGLPRMLNEQHVHCEYPVDADDEYVTEKGFQPSLPGEATKLSSALAMFRGCRIFGKVLDQNYPSASSHEVSLSSISALGDELEEWSNTLPSHLKLEFVQDKPSTNTISSRSPLLSLTYNFVRTLIHRPVVGANLGDRASTSIMALAAAHKQIVQILQLLEERSLGFSHCINKNELLLTSGVGLLVQSLDLDREGKLLKDSQRLVCQVIGLLDKRNAPGAIDFKHLGCAMLSLPLMSPPPSINKPFATGAKRSKGGVGEEAAEGHSNHRHIAQLAASYSRYSLTPPQAKPMVSKDMRKGIQRLHSMLPEQSPRGSSDKALRPLAPSIIGQSSQRHSAPDTPAIEVTRPTSSKVKQSRSPKANGARPNLDYFSFSDGVISASVPIPAHVASPSAPRRHISKENSWESMLSTFDTNPHTRSSSTSIYDWPPMERMLSPTTLESTSRPDHSPKNHTDHEWAQELWSLNEEPYHIPQSVLSFSDESLTSGEEFSSVERSSSDSDFRTISIPHLNTADAVFTPEDFDDVDGFHTELVA